MADLSQPNNPSFNADDHLSRLLPQSFEEPWYRSLYRNIREALNPPKLPPLEVTSKPVAVKDIWGLYGQDKKSFLMSTTFQGIVVALLFTVASSHTVQEKVKQAITPLIAPDIQPYTPKIPPKAQTMQGGGGGGDRSPLPPSKGQAPKFSPRQFTPPMQVINNPNPILQMEPTLIGDPNIQLPKNNLPVWGDPNAAKIGPPSN